MNVIAKDGKDRFLLTFKPAATVAFVAKIGDIPPAAFCPAENIFYSVFDTADGVTMYGRAPTASELAWWLGEQRPATRADASRILDNAFATVSEEARADATRAYFSKSTD